MRSYSKSYSMCNKHTGSKILCSLNIIIRWRVSSAMNSFSFVPQKLKKLKIYGDRQVSRREWCSGAMDTKWIRGCRRIEMLRGQGRSDAVGGEWSMLWGRGGGRGGFEAVGGEWAMRIQCRRKRVVLQGWSESKAIGGEWCYKARQIRGSTRLCCTNRMHNSWFMVRRMNNWFAFIHHRL